MSSAFPTARSRSEYDAQRAMNRYVRLLLHRARNPSALANVPFIDSLCRAMGTRDPAAALEGVVMRVFDAPDAGAIKLRESILEADFKQTTITELARRNGVSRRHFLRRRAEAVAMIAQYVRRIGETA